MNPTTKWDYIKLISRQGRADGSHGGVLDLLHWFDKPSTATITLEEAKYFWEHFGQGTPPPVPEEEHP